MRYQSLNRFLHVSLGIPVIALSLAAAGTVLAADNPSDEGDAPTPKTAPAAPDNLPLVDRNHHLGPGDTIEIDVNGHEEFSKTIRLFTDGSFDYPPFGEVQAAGLTTRELQTKLNDLLKRELRRPDAVVAVKDVYIPPKPVKEIPKITALGAVVKKGEMDLPEPRPLRTVLAEIGWTDSADLSKVRVRYPDGSARTADFSKFNLEGSSRDDIEIKGGEEIIILERPAVQKPDPIRITVLGGGVSKPGTIELDGENNILDVLAKAESTSEADLDKVTVEGPAHSSKLSINVEKYISGDTKAGYTPQQGDVITVPTKPLKVLLTGEIVKPGYVAIDENQTLMEVYFAAGGKGQNGDESRIELIREGKDGKPVKQVVNLRKLQEGSKGDVKLAAGDVIFVPHKKEKKGILYYLQQLTTPIWMLRGGL